MTTTELTPAAPTPPPPAPGLAHTAPTLRSMHPELSDHLGVQGVGTPPQADHGTAASQPGVTPHCITIAVVGETDLVVHGVAGMLGGRSGLQVMGVEHGWRPSSRVAVALVDAFADRRSARSDLGLMLASPLVQKVVVFSEARGDAAMETALSLGADGYVSKNASSEHFTASLHAILIGDRPLNQGQPTPPDDPRGRPHATVTPLTAREAEVLRMIGDGYSNNEVAEACFLSINSVKSYIRSAYRKIGVETRPQAIRWALGQDASGPARARGVG